MRAGLGIDQRSPPRAAPPSAAPAAAGNGSWLHGWRPKAPSRCWAPKTANVQPPSGSLARALVPTANLLQGDTILGMALTQCGHLVHGACVNRGFCRRRAPQPGGRRLRHQLHNAPVAARRAGPGSAGPACPRASDAGLAHQQGIIGAIMGIGSRLTCPRRNGLGSARCGGA